MHFSVILTTLLLGLAAASPSLLKKRAFPPLGVLPKGGISRGCGSHVVPKANKIEAVRLAEKYSNLPPSYLPLPPKRIEVYFHVISLNKTAAGGNVPQEALHKQFKVLTNAYKRWGVTFVLRKITRTVNEQWFYGGGDQESPYEMIMKRTLRSGTYRTLNVYFTNLPNLLLGFCRFPVANPTAEFDLVRDGCVVHYGSVPGGFMAPYNLGHTLTHESGHWFDLYHTFQGPACDPDNDLVEDTPAQSGPTFGCPAQKDTCDLPGSDPFHNFMDYSDDICMTEFTAGQMRRLRASWQQYRAVARV